MGERTSARLEARRREWTWAVRMARGRAWAAGSLAVSVLFIGAVLARLGVLETLVMAGVGALGWAALVAAGRELHRRLALSLSLLPPGLRSPAAVGVAIGLALALAWAGVLALPGAWAPALFGAVTWWTWVEARRARELSRPRHFVEVRHDGQAHLIDVLEGQTLLDALEEAGYRLLAQCGRKGQCAACRVRAHGGGPWSEKQYGPYLTPRQRQQGFVLACQVPVRQDLVIELVKPLVLRWPHVDVTRMGEAARRLRRALPGFDCEVCGHFTCDLYAQAMAEGREPLTKCLPGGEPVRRRLEALAKELQLQLPTQGRA